MWILNFDFWILHSCDTSQPIFTLLQHKSYLNKGCVFYTSILIVILWILISQNNISIELHIHCNKADMITNKISFEMGVYNVHPLFKWDLCIDGVKNSRLTSYLNNIEYFAVRKILWVKLYHAILIVAFIHLNMLISDDVITI